MRKIILASAAITGLAGPCLAQSTVSVPASVTFTPQSVPTLSVDQGLLFRDIPGDTNPAGSQTVGTADTGAARLLYDSGSSAIARSITLPGSPVSFGGSGAGMTLSAFESNFGQGQPVGATGGFTVGATLNYPANVASSANAYLGSFDVTVNFQ